MAIKTGMLAKNTYTYTDAFFSVIPLVNIGKNPTRDTFMKALFLGLILLSSQLYASEKLVTASMDEVFAKVEQKSQALGRSNVLLVFDIDNTILTSVNELGSDQWYSWQEKIMKDANCKPACVSTVTEELIQAQGLLFTMGKMRATEATLAEKIKKLQAEGQSIILLTSRGPDFRSLTEASLRNNGMDFSVSTLNASKDVTGTYLPYDINNLACSGLTQTDVQVAGLQSARPVSFQNGIYMTAGQNKGVMLKVLLKKYKKNFKAIVFADDHVRHVDRMQAIMGEIADVTTYRYAGIDPDVERFNASDKTKIIQDWMKLKETMMEIGF